MAVRSWIIGVAVATMALAGQAWAVVPADAAPGRAPLVREPVEHLAGTAGGGPAWPAVAVDDEGTATAVWRQTYRAADGTRVFRIRAARRGIGGRWSTPRTIGCRPSSCPGAVPRVGVDATGAVTAAWSTGTTVTVVRRPPAGGWRTPRVIATGGHFIRSSLGVAVARNGAAFVVWSSPASVDGELFWAAHRTAGGAWQAPVRLGHGWAPPNPAIGVSATGTAVVAFGDINAYVRAVRFVPGHGWGTSRRIGNGETGAEVLDVKVAVGRGGRALVVWIAMEVYVLRAREMSRRGEWGPVRSISDPRVPYVWANSVPVIDSDGTETVAYVHGDGRVSGTLARKPVGGTWTRARVVTGIREDSVQLVVNRRNDLAVAFGGPLALRPHGSSWSAPAPGRGRIAILPRGSALRMWWTASGLVAQRLHLP